MNLRQILRTRRSAEHKLIEAVRSLFPRGAWMSTCAQRDKSVEGRHYKDAKKRYDDTLNECVKLIEQLRTRIQDTENAFEKENTFNKMKNEHADRRQQWNDRNNPDET